MRISEVTKTIQAQIAMERTSCGRSITQLGVDTCQAVLDDTENYEQDAIKCKNCCIILSSLVIPEGCVNCGCKDVTYDITDQDILR